MEVITSITSRNMMRRLSLTMAEPLHKDYLMFRDIRVDLPETFTIQDFVSSHISDGKRCRDTLSNRLLTCDLSILGHFWGLLTTKTQAHRISRQEWQSGFEHI
jgi:hypothetical protein